jgi:hypothetical protein
MQYRTPREGEVLLEGAQKRKNRAKLYWANYEHPLFQKIAQPGQSCGGGRVLVADFPSTRRSREKFQNAATHLECSVGDDEMLSNEGASMQ